MSNLAIVQFAITNNKNAMFFVCTC